MKQLIGLVMVSVLLCAAPAAMADAVTGFAFRITATNTYGSDSVTVPLSSLTYNVTNNRWTWTPSGQIVLGDLMSPLATLNSATVTYEFKAVKRLSLTSNFTAGNADTVITIDTGTMVFPQIRWDLAQARATASFGVSDASGNNFGRIEEYPLSTGAGMYGAYYNGSPGTKFRGLVSWAQTNGSSPASVTESYPAGSSFAALGAATDSMTTRYSLRLTANDTGNGTQAYFVMPEPGVVFGLLAGVALVLRRR
jgi:hypothetical protein